MFAWDQYHAYLFDIDGTLLHCRDAVHYFGFCSVLTEVAGRPLNLDGVVAHGNTDVGILRDALALAGVAESVWRPQLAAMREALCAYVQTHKNELCVDALPGAHALVDRLRAGGARVGVATGNLERIGWEKLAAAGFASAFHFGAFSDQCETRSQVFAAAMTQLGANTRVCVIGDTPADIRAARENGLDVIAVATGIYSYEELQSFAPDLMLHSLEELVAPPLQRG